MEFKLNLFEIIVSAAALLIIISIWFINRNRKAHKPKVQLETGLLILILTVTIAIVAMLIRSPIVRDNPLLFAIAILSFFTAASGISDMYLTYKFKKDLEVVVNKFGSQVAGLGNMIFFPTKEETFKNLTAETYRATEKLMATRFSPADISTESEYWGAIKERAFDPTILYIRIHSLAHTSSTSIDGVCKLIAELRGARQFRLGIAFFNNEFELIVADDHECVFCFHDLEMTIKNGFRVDKNLPSSVGVVDNFGASFRRMLEKCYIVIDFEKFVRTEDDVKMLQDHLRKMHKEYCQGMIPKPISRVDMENYLKSDVFTHSKAG